MALISQSELQKAVMASFIREVEAFKPGNISRYSAGHGMHVDDFIRSAEVSTPILCRPELSVGKRILESVKATRATVGCNTNLGMLLLFSPIIKAFETHTEVSLFRENLNKVLVALHNQDTRDIFKAIRVANPGGLGQSDKYDVHSRATVNIIKAMDEAKERDTIALQYTNGFDEIFAIGLTTIRKFYRYWNNVEWAVVACYLTFMANLPDSHIQRKFGKKVAAQVRRKTVPLLNEFENNNNPDSRFERLLGFDKELKDSGINPGTSADLTAASLLLYQLGV